MSIWLLKPFLVAILTGAVLAYIAYPIYKWLLKYVKRKNITAFIVAIIIGLIILIPLIIAVSLVSREAYIVYLSGRQRLAGVTLEDCQHTACVLFKDVLDNPDFALYARQGLERAANYLLEAASNFLLSIPNLLLNVFVSFFVMFYLLRDGKILMKKINGLMEMKKYHHKQIIQRLDDVMYGVVYGNILVALVQGLVAALGFYFFGVQAPIVWGLVTAIAALIPYIGTVAVWLPISLVYVLDGVLASDNTLVWKGFGVFMYGLLLISSIDNLIKPKIIGDRTKVHPVVILLGMLGGLTLMGVAGFIVGPVLLAITITFVDIYLKK